MPPDLSDEYRAVRNAQKAAWRARKLAADPDYRKRLRTGQLPRQAERRRERLLERPFEGCDGEGVKIVGDDGVERSEYRLLRLGDRELVAPDRRLETPELLDFILDHPPGSLLVGFAFEYDVSNILRDLPPEKIAHVLSPERPGSRPGARPWTRITFRGRRPMGVAWLPNNYFRVCRLHLDRRTGKVASISGSVRTIYDSFSFFQSSFVNALKQSGLPGLESLLEHMAAMKSARASFAEITPEIRAYCAEECEWLAKLMTDFRAKVLDVESRTGARIRPITWNGPGKMASALFRQEKIMKRVEAEALLPAGLQSLAAQAYYGGRFEVSGIGFIDQPCWDHDINSAYPAAAQEMPCLTHGTWVPLKPAALEALWRNQADRSIYVARVYFEHPREMRWHGLPFRALKPSRLIWPRVGNGVYWSEELRSAWDLGAYVSFQPDESGICGWLYESDVGCTCKPFAALARLYEARLELGKDGVGKPLKLPVNAAYGILAQRIGAAAYRNLVWAGMMTAYTRAAINRAIALDPESVVMVATDGILATAALPVEAGTGLGLWEVKPYPEGMFVVKSGLYWNLAEGRTGLKVKTRGTSPKFLTPAIQQFESRWLETLGAWEKGMKPARPYAEIMVDQFYSLRLAEAKKDPSLACQWRREVRKISFEFRDKRQPGAIEGRRLRLEPLPGWPQKWSHVVVSEAERSDYQQSFAMTALERSALPSPPDLGLPIVEIP